MQGVFTNLIGQKFNLLTVVDGPLKSEKEGGSFWLCRCDCGNYAKKLLPTKSLTKSKTKSCGCLVKKNVQKANKTHGMTKTTTYTSWKSMWQRCTNKNHKSYNYYKNIEISEDWKNFERFLQDMGERPPKTSLDRINPEIGYSKQNCRWATQKEQSLNKHKTLKVLIGEEVMTVKSACEKFGSSYNRARRRIAYGWCAYDAVMTKKTNKWERQQMNENGVFIREQA